MTAVSYSDIPEIVRKFVGVFEALRRLGFLSDQIFFEVAKAPQLGRLKSGAFRSGAFATLKAQGKSFCVILGEVKKPEALMKEYTRAVTAINERRVPQADMDRMWQESLCHQDPQSFAAALLLKGFTFPRRSS